MKEPVGIAGRFDGVDVNGIASSGVCAGLVAVTVAVVATLKSVSHLIIEEGFDI